MLKNIIAENVKELQRKIDPLAEKIERLQAMNLSANDIASGKAVTYTVKITGKGHYPVERTGKSLEAATKAAEMAVENSSSSYKHSLGDYSATVKVRTQVLDVGQLRLVPVKGKYLFYE